MPEHPPGSTASNHQTKLAVLEVIPVTPPHYYVGMAQQQLADEVSIALKYANRDCNPSKIDYQPDSPIPMAMPRLTEILLDADGATLLREPSAVAWGRLEAPWPSSEPEPLSPSPSQFAFNRIVTGDARTVLADLPADSVSLSFWSPPYYVGKSYERHLSFEDWQELIREVIHCHTRVIQPGGFMAVNIGDILCFPDESMPRFQADNVRRKKVAVTKEQILETKQKHPDASRHELAKLLGCSEQTIQRRLEDNNVRGGKHSASTKIKLTGCLVVEWAEEAGFYLYDQRIWHKDPCWANSRWHSNSYRAVDEFEHIYVFWKPGITEYDRHRLSAEEWADWGSRGVWQIPSVRRNDRHEAEFPEELAERVIRLFSPAGGVVLDPFVGTGTTTAVASRIGRQWIGIDNDPANTEIACQRTNEA